MSTTRQTLLKPLCISLLAALTMMSVWFTLSASTDSALCGFALLAAADIALLERWMRTAGQRSPAWVAPLLTGLCCLASLWLITALNVSAATGFGLRASAGGMGFGLFLNLLEIRLQPLDWSLLAVSPGVAMVLAKAGISGHRQSP